MVLENSKQNPIPNGGGSISQCLEKIKTSWIKKGSLGGLIQDWKKITGTQLASNCTPLHIHNKVLTVGASHPQWRQALLYNRIQLIKSLKSHGYNIKEIRIQQYYPVALVKGENEKEIWSKHPSRTDIHGLSTCQICKAPSPNGEINLWGKCCFCRRKELNINKIK